MKKITIKNPSHPVNMRDTCGQRAKEAARKLSNKQLDELLETNIPDADDLKTILIWTRGEKIKFIVRVSKDNFVKAWNESQELQPTKAVE